MNIERLIQSNIVIVSKKKLWNIMCVQLASCLIYARALLEYVIFFVGVFC